MFKKIVRRAPDVVLAAALLVLACLLLFALFTNRPILPWFLNVLLLIRVRAAESRLRDLGDLIKW